MKTNQVTKYLFKKQIVLLGELYLFAFAIIFLLPLLLSVISGTLSDYSFVGLLKGAHIAALFGIFMIAISTLSYENFKFLIQNGISRKTFFEAQLTVYGILILIGNTINLFYDYLIVVPLTHASTFNTFMSLYADFFDNPFVSVTFNFIFSALLLVFGALAGMTVGSFMTLFSKLTQRIILIATPVVGVVTMAYVANATNNAHYQMSWVVNFAKFIIGENGNDVLNPFPMMGFLLVLSAIMIVIIRYLFAKKQLKKA
ncbi:MAG: ABC transporter permease [Lentilactobacillus diolivorans]|uniref:ABC superfamily ATP binding cassette transporter, permease protein n=2 Tax=Lentilactobacillus diolivorans TaxID=179838 RepID=A0A0R1SMV3_9LACO|nr:hypothetical protein [Lentilactobacillus diolivorans]RRG04481.1 MAG: ABC transporter permease [Lactobacillus sp.]KRL69012.1 ABC superfamily ATP binding cassette transporter, permease protein [Lentilactobacillus diolivorans DSM 14421]MCH4163418.1 ABC transporter permease [Lentilactobacillus diolivorans]MDH5104349.1 ABC transporter permease [Lentilactobacillus diolivorans]GEP22542.1 ABC transporter permease [Lentilactobacillus diolivorans]